jgi:hypothetical protein
MSNGICDARHCRKPSVISYGWDGTPGNFELCDIHNTTVCEGSKQTKDAVLELCGKQARQVPATLEDWNNGI